MKTPLLLTAALLGTVLPALADVEVTMAELNRIGLLPQDKADLRPEEKLDKRKNPFAERKKTVAARPSEQVETEESKLRTFFDKQKITGLMKFGDKYIVSLGRLALEPGQIVPPIIPNQTHILRVIKVTDSELGLGWVEDATLGLAPAVGRKIQKKINLRPEVASLIVSEDSLGENAQMYTQDDHGKIMVPQKNVFPNPSDIVDSLPPGSDTNPASALTEQERQDLSAVDQAGNTPPPPAPPPDDIPDAVPSGGDTPAPPPAEENPEDEVQPDPDLADPGAGTTPAGPPPGK